MKQSFTPNHLIRFIYKETSILENVLIREMLERDWKLREQYEDLMYSINRLPEVEGQPGIKTLNKILKYSKESTFEAQV